MGIVDRIADDLTFERQTRDELAYQAWLYRTDDPAALRAIHEHEGRIYPESTLPCRGCQRAINVMLLALCEECGGMVCATCDPPCPHEPAGAAGRGGDGEKGEAA